MTEWTATLRASTFVIPSPFGFRHSSFRRGRVGKPSYGKDARRGISSLQVIFILPILILFTIAVVQYGAWLVTKQTIAASCAKAARTAARGGELRDVKRTVAKVLATNKMGVSDNGDVAIVVERYGKPSETAGNPQVTCRRCGPEVQPGEVRVTVCVRRGRFAGRRIPNWLGVLDRWFTPRQLQCSSLAAVE
jgi:TadE-like protein